MDSEPEIVIRRAEPGDEPVMADCVAAYRRYADRIGRPPWPMPEDYGYNRFFMRKSL